MQQLNPSEISETIKGRIEKLDVISQARNEGTIVSVSDGIVRIYGLVDVMYGEMIRFPDGVYGMALDLEQDSADAVVLGEYQGLAEDVNAKCTGHILEVPVGPELLGHVVDTLGNPIDGKGPIDAKATDTVEKVVPGVIRRKLIDQPVQTGHKSIDTMISVGHGQRELIIGDRQIGKTALTIDAIIDQKDSGIKYVYVATGQKQSTIANIVHKPEGNDAPANTIVVAVNASGPVALQYLVPYSGCTMGEYFRNRGEDALVVYDNLFKQAVAYRQVSLLLYRPLGREAYPGDVFYLHSHLLERASYISEEYVRKFTNGAVTDKTGPLTAPSIIETQADDTSAFIPTNVISIIDGQIFLESAVLNSSIRPAVNASISVPCVGDTAQTKIVKKLSGDIRTALAQRRELTALIQFASDLDEATREQPGRGQRVTEPMKQRQYVPTSIVEISLSPYATERGLLQDVETVKVGSFGQVLISYFQREHTVPLAKIDEGGDFDDEIDAGTKAGIEKFKVAQTW